MAANKPETWEQQLRSACAELLANKSMRQLAGELDVDYAQLHRFMAGAQSLGLGTAEKVATALGFELTRKKNRNSGKPTN